MIKRPRAEVGAGAFLHSREMGYFPVGMKGRITPATALMGMVWR